MRLNLNIQYKDMKIVMSASLRGKMGQLITAFLLCIVGLALTPTVQEQVNNITGSGGNNLTGAAAAIAKLIPMFWVFGIIGVTVGLVYITLAGGILRRRV